ncbi:c-type cytochrome, partial [Kaarinaea lacus]
AAYPFALGEIPLDAPAETLTTKQQLGLQLFLNSCISCHDRANVKDEGEFWEPRAVSFPRNQYQHTAPQQADTTTGATPYAKHDLAPQLSGLSSAEAEGEKLFQKNCAFCHAADGTGKNWIGSFLQPHPRNLTDPKTMGAMTQERLKQTIRDGLPGTTMSAWKGVLSDEQIDNIIAYINRAFHPIKE